MNVFWRKFFKYYACQFNVSYTLNYNNAKLK